MEEKQCCECCHKTKERSQKEYKDLMNRFNKVLLGNHIRTCVAENIRQGNDEIIDELVILLQKLMK